MHLTSKAYAILALALVATAPALAATDAAVVTNALKADAMPVASVTAMVGQWSTADLSFLDKATAIKVFDTKTLYQAPDQKKIASAEAGKSADLTKLRAAIKADTGLNGWFTAHKIDVSRVIAVADPNGSPQIFLY
jgi:hypothetical protein